MSTPTNLSEQHRQTQREKPLVNAITNNVTVNQVANIILHWGGLPVMSDDIRELDEMVSISGACLLNMGTVSETGEEAMIRAGEAARQNDVPLVIDPVGAGATETRTRIATRLADDLPVSILNGNRGEIAAIAGKEANVQGVESVGDHPEIAETAMACARQIDAIVVASGATDIVASTQTTYEITAGDELMSTVVGTGCMLGGTLAAFAGGSDDYLSAALAGTLAFGLAGEAAVDEYGTVHGPGSYEPAFRDAAANFSPDKIDSHSNRITPILQE